MLKFYNLEARLSVFDGHKTESSKNVSFIGSKPNLTNKAYM